MRNLVVGSAVAGDARGDRGLRGVIVAFGWSMDGGVRGVIVAFGCFVCWSRPELTLHRIWLTGK